MVPHQIKKIRHGTTLKLRAHKMRIMPLAKSVIWFFAGIFIGMILFLGSSYIFYQKLYEQKAYRGVIIHNINVGGKTREEIQKLFIAKNDEIGKKILVFSSKDFVATLSAREISAGLDDTLLADQALAIGRTKNIFTNTRLILQAYLNGIHLTPSYSYSDQQLNKSLVDISAKVKKEPVNAQFEFNGEKITIFKPALNGQEIDYDALNTKILATLPHLTEKDGNKVNHISIPIRVIKPAITSEKAEELGLKELIGKGTSLYKGSIESRAFNIALAASRLHGTLIPPGETFSFNKAVGDISTLTGYKQAYVIKEGHTILGDGGGVCQVSTTLFRAALNAGLPIVERHHHSYRVSYYELDSPPGLDATIYLPDVDLRFINDTGKYILVQTVLDKEGERITFELYGTSDGRQVTLTKPIITSQTLPPDPLYQDDPTLPRGTVKQIEHAIAGARVSFERTVTKKNEEPVSETFISPYRAWQAVYLVGTKE